MRVAVAGGTGLAGSQVVAALEAQGDAPVVLSRATGVDLTTGEGLAERLAGVEVIIDTTGPPTFDRQGATAFFEAVARTVHERGAAAGVRRLVGLSIVGIDGLEGRDYYAAKLAQERAWRAGNVPVTILRASQFHDFGRQLMAWSRDGAQVLVPEQPVRTVDVGTVGKHLARLAHEPVDGTVELVGPEEDTLLRQVRRLIEVSGEPLTAVEVRPDNEAEASIRAGALQGGPDAIVDGSTFEEWLTAGDERAPVSA